MQNYAIVARRAKTGKREHIRTIVRASSRSSAMRAYGCNVRGKQRTIVTSRGWKLSAEPVVA